MIPVRDAGTPLSPRDAKEGLEVTTGFPASDPGVIRYDTALRLAAAFGLLTLIALLAERTN